MKMNHIIKFTAVLFGSAVLLSGCVEETFPEGGGATGGQISDSPFATEGVLTAMPTLLMSNATDYLDEHIEFGYMGMGAALDRLAGEVFPVAQNLPGGNQYYDRWQPWLYTGTSALDASKPPQQFFYNNYYAFIYTTNQAISIFSQNESMSQELGIAKAFRAMLYLDMARLYDPLPAKASGAEGCNAYVIPDNIKGLTVPIVREGMTTEELENNPRVPRDEMFEFILGDLNEAETLVAEYKRPADKMGMPNLAVVYGLKARAYLTMENFPEAEKYAVKAQTGYAPMTEAEWLDKTTGFNTLSNRAWMWGMQQSSDDPIIKSGKGRYSWIGSFCVEQSFGYAGMNGGCFPMIDAHLYATIPATDFRKRAFLAPSDAGSLAGVAKYTDYVPSANLSFRLTDLPPYTSFKFRPADKGYTDYMVGTAVGIPLMRVEEMMLIEAEAIGMQPDREAEGRQKLAAFAALRDPNYRMPELTSFRDAVWWQRRVELWGEGFATFDIKRLKKGIIRSYAGTNHTAGYRFNTTSVPQWMNFVIISTEFDNNHGLGENNPTPTPPAGDSPEHQF